MSEPRRIAAVLIAGACLALAAAAQAAKPDRKAQDAAAVAAAIEAALTQIQSALDEKRYVDAARTLDEAMLSGLTDPRFVLKAGELDLAKAQYDQALTEFRKAEAIPALKAKALEGEGLALSQLSHPAEAMTALKAAVTLDPKAWRAWNALGGEYDLRHDWDKAHDAYEQALVASDRAAPVLNNYGYSLLLQGKAEAASPYFVEALQMKPDLTEARTNLRLAIAMKGDYDRASGGGAAGDRAASLNNAGFAAMVRGDYDKAEDLFQAAIKAKGEFYARAEANLEVVRQLKKQAKNEH